MRATVTLLAAVLALLVMPAGAAARQQAGCPNDNAGFILVDLQTWWDTVSYTHLTLPTTERV